ncbi:MAG: hypothetical protein FJ086_18475 [Deltaproteobacteria bacterium]|nr:hypothetical protein [Deltaproteobacteria bacterium]
MDRFTPPTASIRFPSRKPVLVRYAFPTEKDAREYFNRMKRLADKGRIEAVRLDTARGSGSRQVGVLQMPSPPPEPQPCTRCPECKDFQPRMLFLGNDGTCSFCVEAREAAAAGARGFRGMFRSLKEARAFVEHLRRMGTTHRVDAPVKTHGPDREEAWHVTWAARPERKERLRARVRPAPRARTSRKVRGR